MQIRLLESRVRQSLFLIGIATFFAGHFAAAQDIRAASQAMRQDANRKIQPLRTPDFRPFTAELAARRERLTALNAKLDNASIAQMRSMLDSNELTAVELVLWYVDRIRRYDVGKLRSVIELNPDALTDAVRLDAELKAGKSHGRLHGIPILLKDNIGTTGKLHTTGGAAAMLDARPDRDAFIVQRLRAAGAIVLGKTNLTEWANFMTNRSVNGFSAVGGQTINPYGKFEVGGSSAGSSAAAAAHFAAATIGSETYGSIVYPASFNSVVGLKSTVALVSRDRIIPITDATDTAGPIARSSADAAAVMSAIAGVDVNDPETAEAAPLAGFDFAANLDADYLRGKKIALLNGGPAQQIDEPIRKKTIETLQAAGAIIEEIPFERRTYPFGRIFQCGYKNGVDTYLQLTKAPFPTLETIVQFNAADMPIRAPFGQRIMEESVRQKLPMEEYRKLVAQNRKDARDALEPIFANHDLIVSWEYAGMHGGVFPMSGVPVLCLPAGYRPTGEPMGFLFAARRFEDAKVLAAGNAFEQLAKVRVPPKLVE